MFGRRRYRVEATTRPLARRAVELWRCPACGWYRWVRLPSPVRVLAGYAALILLSAVVGHRQLPGPSLWQLLRF
jgi:hypothetical protein